MHGPQINPDESADPLRAVIEQPPPEIPGASSFEHQRILGRVLSNMFGTVNNLEIAGRYRVLERLGAGGMGEVYLCDDLELHREVAVKHVRGSGSDDDHRRLLREARAQARLTHPNVVRVYDAGTHAGRTFLAMEYVEGQTLAGYLAAGGHGAREILAHYIAAGRGLAAAHHADLVHRDFKPDNVLIGVDGVVRVADFGLAIATRAHEELGESTVETDGAEPDVSTRVSRGVRGTIRYMSLEHLRGDEVDARSDQFSFCVALYEGLWGAAPFETKSLVTRLAALERDSPLVPRGMRSLWRIVRRGLSRDPNARWPNMDALLDALAAVPRRRQQLVVCFAAASALGVAVAATQLMAGDVCATAGRDLDRVWSVASRTELGQRFRGLEVSHAAHSWALVEAGIERWATRWIDQQGELCHAREGLQTEPARLRTRDLCLTRQLREVEHFVTALGDADASTLAQAAAAVTELPVPADCEAEFERSNFDPPRAAIADAVADVRADIGHARSLRRLGRVDLALEIATRADERATTLGYGPLQAEAKTEHAMAEDTAGAPRTSSELYKAAIALAEQHHHDQLLPPLWIEWAELSLFELPSERMLAATFLDRAKAAYARNGGPDVRARARLSFVEGRIAELAGDRDAARTAYRRAIDEGTAASALELPRYLDSLANLVAVRERLQLRAAAVAFANDHYGPRHPRTAEAIYNDGVTRRDAGAGGREQLELAVAIWREADATPPTDLGHAAHVLGVLALNDRELAHARSYADEAQHVFAKVLEPDDHRHALPLQLLAKIAGIEGDHESALDYARRAASAFERSKHGVQDERALEMRIEAANQLLGLVRFDEAQIELDAILRWVGDHAQLEAQALLLLAELHLRQAAPDRADERLQALEALGVEPDANYEVLRRIVDLRLGRTPAREPARSQEIIAAYGTETLVAWLKELGVSEAERALLGFDFEDKEK